MSGGCSLDGKSLRSCGRGEPDIVLDLDLDLRRSSLLLSFLSLRSSFLKRFSSFFLCFSSFSSSVSSVGLLSPPSIVVALTVGGSPL